MPSDGVIACCKSEPWTKRSYDRIYEHGDVFDNVCFVFLFLNLQLSENENMPAYLPQRRIGKKDKEKATRTLLQTTEPKVTGSNPVGCTFKSLIKKDLRKTRSILCELEIC